MTIHDLFEKLGGAPAVSRELRVPYTTVVSWRQRNKVPHWRIPALVGLAVSKGVSVPADLTGLAA